MHLRARQYNPSVGRFTTVDPVQPGAPGTTGYNLYTYAANNPTTFTDPTGQTVLTERAVLGALALGTTAYVALVLPEQLRSVLDQPLGGAPVIDIDVDLPDLDRLTNEISDFLAEQVSTSPGEESQEELIRDPLPPFIPNDRDDDVRIPVLFGQRRISPTSQDTNRTPITTLVGRPIIPVFESPSNPDVLIAAGNRRLAAYSFAGVVDAPVCLRSPTAEETRRLGETPIPPQTALPSPVISVTPTIPPLDADVNSIETVSPHRIVSTVMAEAPIVPCVGG